ncbi:ABC transporter permease [Ruminococcus albus]|jgi:ABC-2 type transport system permease protein|uniref:ABC transporter n=1 Tax=Ruminococcus albus SY3 TaxID=1341156 RepID=A0A011UFL3_RUMAL|nr:ABC transporter permease [Ruminococcus albus]EXM39429.1 ABC transporter [Ruminococcus albus SY3]MBE6869166.1 ABC transporter permease [Ruminococcus albus]
MKFKTLFIKELREMLSVQTIMTMVISVVILSFAGQAMSKAVEESSETMMDINICDQDDTEFTKNMIKFLTANLAQLDGEVNVVEISSDDYAKELKNADVKSVVIIPEGFTASVENNEAAKVKFVQRLNSLATMSNLNTGSQVAVEYLTAAVKDVVYSTKVSNGKLSNEEVSFLNNPIALEESTVVAEKSADISASVVMSLCSAQGMIVPIMMFVLVMMSSNMILNAISTEKIDKTLETLLTAPISRLSVIAAKMLAAAVVAAMQAAVYMFGSKNMMNGVLEKVGSDSGYSEILKDLGLTMDAGQYVLVGIQMFLSILIALSVALVLGVLAKDAKSAQTLTLPIMMCTMIPYMLSMFVDIKTMSPAVRYVVYAIPFTHSFMASENAMFGNYGVYAGGLIYQFIFLVICMAAALKIFMSDKIFTMSIGGKKSKGTTPAESES